MATVAEPPPSVTALAAVQAVTAVAAEQAAVAAVAGRAFAAFHRVQTVADEPAAVAEHRSQRRVRVGHLLGRERTLLAIAAITAAVEREEERVFLVRHQLDVVLRRRRSGVLNREERAEARERGAGDSGGQVGADRGRTRTVLGMLGHGNPLYKFRGAAHLPISAAAPASLQRCDQNLWLC